MLTGLRMAKQHLEAEYARGLRTATRGELAGFEAAMAIVNGLIEDVRKSVRIFPDGTTMYAVYGDFINLQDSVAGMGSTASEALLDLIAKESR